MNRMAQKYFSPTNREIEIRKYLITNLFSTSLMSTIKLVIVWQPSIHTEVTVKNTACVSINLDWQRHMNEKFFF